MHNIRGILWNDNKQITVIFKSTNVILSERSHTLLKSICYKILLLSNLKLIEVITASTSEGETND